MLFEFEVDITFNIFWMVSSKFLKEKSRLNNFEDVSYNLSHLLLVRHWWVQSPSTATQT